MQQTSPIQQVDLNLSSLVPPMQRAEGVHVSDCIEYLVTKGGLSPRDEGVALTKDWAAFGNVWEEGLFQTLNLQLEGAPPNVPCEIGDLYPGRFEKVAELALDDIYGNPDMWDRELKAVGEVKLKWLSSRNEIHGAKFDHIWQQCKAYCKMMGTNRALLFVGYVAGDWSFMRKGVPFTGPQWVPFYREFYDWELNVNWANIKYAARELRGAT